MSPAAARPRVVLVHWSAAETPDRVARLEAGGYDVVCVVEMSPAVLEAIKRDPPAAFVIDLSRLPSHGRRVGEVVREQKPTRHSALVFVDGDEEKRARVRQSLPDATYTTWPGVVRALATALAHPPAAPVVPSREETGYSGTPLPKKLGIKADVVVALLGAPPDFERTLGELPRGVTLRGDLRRSPDVAMFFVTTGAALERALPKLRLVLGSGGGAWVAWPKKTSGVASDLTETIIRARAIANGLVDFKVCAIDATWSGLRLAKRRVTN